MFVQGWRGGFEDKYLLGGWVLSGDVSSREMHEAEKRAGIRVCYGMLCCVCGMWEWEWEWDVGWGGG